MPFATSWACDRRHRSLFALSRGYHEDRFLLCASWDYWGRLPYSRSPRCAQPGLRDNMEYLPTPDSGVLVQSGGRGFGSDWGSGRSNALGQQERDDLRDLVVRGRGPVGHLDSGHGASALRSFWGAVPDANR
jgi:hypothetical protein